MAHPTAAAARINRSWARCLLRLLLSVAGLSIAAQAQRPDLGVEKLQGKIRTEYTKLCSKMQVPEMKVEQLQGLLGDSKLILIDVRAENEQEVSMLPGALTPKEFARKYRGGIPDSAVIVTYCTIGYRSGKYARKLMAKDIVAHNLVGGVLSWSHAGGKFQRPDSTGAPVPTSEVHVYDKDWNFLHPDYRAKY